LDILESVQYTKIPKQGPPPAVGKKHRQPRHVNGPERPT